MERSRGRAGIVVNGRRKLQVAGFASFPLLTGLYQQVRATFRASSLFV
jgi:hypothetical protein